MWLEYKKDAPICQDAPLKFGSITKFAAYNLYKSYKCIYLVDRKVLPIKIARSKNSGRCSAVWGEFLRWVPALDAVALCGRGVSDRRGG